MCADTNTAVAVLQFYSQIDLYRTSSGELLTILLEQLLVLCDGHCENKRLHILETLQLWVNGGLPTLTQRNGKTNKQK